MLAEPPQLDPLRPYNPPAQRLAGALLQMERHVLHLPTWRVQVKCVWQPATKRKCIAWFKRGGDVRDTLHPLRMEFGMGPAPSAEDEGECKRTVIYGDYSGHLRVRKQTCVSVFRIVPA